jgi:hypothetical protein
MEFIDTPEARRIVELAGGTQVSRRRASHVEPDAAPLRWLFHALRHYFGEEGKVAAWTRSWLCLWRVNMQPSNGPILDERWIRREDALRAEVQWLEQNCF